MSIATICEYIYKCGLVFILTGYAVLVFYAYIDEKINEYWERKEITND
jgi:hypothetical protein